MIDLVFCIIIFLKEKKMKNEFQKIYNELCEGENIINNKLQGNIDFNDNYELYGIVNKHWVNKYKKYIIDYLNNKSSRSKFKYKIDELRPKTEEKIFCLTNEDENHTYYFPCEYILVTHEFIKAISPYFDYHGQNKLNKRLYDILIGGQCVIRRDHNNVKNHYITLSYNVNGNNKVDFILYFEDQEKMKEHLNIILNNNFKFYTQLIKYSN